MSSLADARGRLGSAIASPVLRRAFALAIVASAALIVRIVGIDHHSLWFDEALEYGRAVQPAVSVVRARSIDQDPPLFALLLHVWLQVGAQEAWIRLPSALLGAAASIVATGWAWRRFGSVKAVLSGVLIGIAPVLVYYGQEVNQYAAVVFFSVTLLVLYERVVDRGLPLDWLAYGLVSLLALATHYGMVFPLAVLGIGLTRHVLRSRCRRTVRYLVSYAVVMTACAAVLWWLGLGEGLTVPHLQRRFGGTHLQKEIDYVKDVGWREVLVFYLLPYSGGPALTLVRLLSLAALAGAAVMWRTNDSGRRVVVLFFGGLGLTYLTSLMGWYPLGYRYGLFVAPWLLLALGMALGELWQRQRVLGAIVSASVTITFLAFLPQLDEANRWLHVPREDLRPVADYVRDARAPGDAVYVYYGAVPAFGYYWRNDHDGVIVGRFLSAASKRAELGRIRAAADIHGRVWLVLSHEAPGDGDALLASLTTPTKNVRGLRLTDSTRFLGASAFALEP